jgi:ketol-acid reductoisomerase
VQGLAVQCHEDRRPVAHPRADDVELEVLLGLLSRHTLALIKTECITELKLIAELLDELGPAATLEKISPTARAGAALMFETLSNPYTRKQFDARLARVRSGEFFQDLETGAAKRPAETLAAHLRKLESEVLQ